MLIKNINCWDVRERSYFMTDLRVSGGKIEKIGRRQPVYQDTEMYDLNGKYAYPAFIDSHMHVIALGESLTNQILNSVNSEEKLRHIILDSDEEVVVLTGWNEETLGFTPDREYLDSVVDTKPVILIRRCYHSAVVNSAAIREYQLDKYDGVDGSEVTKGYVRESVLSYLESKSPEKDIKKLNKYLNKAAASLKSWGITTVHSDDYRSVSFEDFNRFGIDNREIRIAEKINPGNFDGFTDFMSNKKDFFRKHTDFWNVNAIKLFMDGSLGAKTALLSEHYEGEKDNFGVCTLDQTELKNMIRISEKNGISVMVHCIGDQALENCIKAFEGNIENGNPCRHRLIHVQMASEKQLKRIKKLNLYLSIQPVFYDSDINTAKKNLGQERLEKIGYPFGKMNDMGIEISFSTDSPIESINPFENLASAMRFMPLEDAFHHYTFSGARAEGSESCKGRIAEGYLADLFVTSEDIFGMSSSEIKNVKPQRVLFNGLWFL